MNVCLILVRLPQPGKPQSAFVLKRPTLLCPESKHVTLDTNKCCPSTILQLWIWCRGLQRTKGVTVSPSKRDTESGFALRHLSLLALCSTTWRCRHEKSGKSICEFTAVMGTLQEKSSSVIVAGPAYPFQFDVPACLFYPNTESAVRMSRTRFLFFFFSNKISKQL